MIEIIKNCSEQQALNTTETQPTVMGSELLWLELPSVMWLRQSLDKMVIYIRQRAPVPITLQWNNSF